jgi:hypothetical protein
LGRRHRERQCPAFGSGNRWVGLRPLNVLRCMNGHDVVQVNETVMATPDLEDEPIEIKAGWRGKIIGHADKPTPCILFDESYRGKPFIVDLDAANLEVVWANPFKIRTRIDENAREWTNVDDWVKSEYEWLKLTPEQIAERRQEVRDFLDRHPELDRIKTKK